MKNAVGERKEVEYKWNIAVTYFVKSDLFEIDYQVTTVHVFVNDDKRLKTSKTKLPIIVGADK